MGHLFASTSVFVQRSPTDYGVSECDREAWTVGRPWTARDCCAVQKQRFII